MATVVKRRISDRSRELYARNLERLEPKMKNLADSIRTGFENLWITPGLHAIEDALAEGADDGSD